VTYRLNWYREWWDIWYGLTSWKGLVIGVVFSVPRFCRILVRDPVFVIEELEWEGVR